VLSESYLVSELDAIYYMVTSVFGHKMKHVSCPYCECAHLDKDWFSVHPHRRHLCAGCGRHFRDTEADRKSDIPD
jgi:transposase-like protein